MCGILPQFLIHRRSAHTLSVSQIRAHDDDDCDDDVEMFYFVIESGQKPGLPKPRRARVAEPGSHTNQRQKIHGKAIQIKQRIREIEVQINLHGKYPRGAHVISLSRRL